MAGLGWQELLVVLVIVMIIFGAGKLPEVARSLGQGVKEFKKESTADPLASTTTASSTAAGGVDAAPAATVSGEKQVRADDI
ncbi:MAG TPA: twin-arginine translocase TatA/TatE family subunit [Thermomicrobiales bacterium]|jgi:sec-independent protein translocase protein TatA|nr:twin-arginine translocase TatA/TatE family subunit [Thermomicrobiales bacterium]